MKIVKLSVLVILGIALFIRCSKEEDDLISQNCETDCTEIIGRLMTDNGTVPISDIELTVKYNNRSGLSGGIIRTKAMTRTDAEGNFRLRFFIRNDELNDSDSSFFIEYEINENEYLTGGSDDFNLPGISRDTILNVAYNLPRKAFINLSLLNLENVQPPDWFATTFVYEQTVGFDRPIDGHHFGWSSASEQNNLIEVAGNQSIEMSIIRRVNDVTTTEIETLFLEAGTTTNLTIDFNN